MNYNKEQLEAKEFYTINKLSELIGADRRTLNKRLASEEPDHVLGRKNYYDLNRVSDIIEEDPAQMIWTYKRASFSAIYCVIAPINNTLNVNAVKCKQVF
jgi:hypothetical protein